MIFFFFFFFGSFKKMFWDQIFVAISEYVNFNMVIQQV